MVDERAIEELRSALERIVEDQLGELADTLVPRLVEALAPLVGPQSAGLPERLVGVSEVAAYVGVTTRWVHANADQLRARRLSPAKRAAMRFSLADVDAALLALGRRPSKRRRKS